MTAIVRFITLVDEFNNSCNHDAGDDEKVAKTLLDGLPVLKTNTKTIWPISTRVIICLFSFFFFSSL